MDEPIITIRLSKPNESNTDDFAVVNRQSIEKTIRNVQIYPTKERIELNDKMTKVFFNLDQATYDALRSGEFADIVESSDDEEILTPFTIISPYNDPPNEFDRAVLSVCTSEYKAGNHYTTPDIIFRALVGKVGEVGIVPYKNQLAAILHSIDKLMDTSVSYDTSKSFTKLRYKIDKDKAVISKSSVLPSCRVNVTINGKVADVIYFDRLSPLYDITNAKNQFIRFDSHLLNVSNQNNTPLVISLKTYVLRRVAEIKAHKQLAPTITWDNVFQHCKISNASQKIKHDARETINKLFENLQNQDFIKSFKLAKKTPQAKFSYGISFTF